MTKKTLYIILNSSPPIIRTRLVWTNVHGDWCSVRGVLICTSLV